MTAMLATALPAVAQAQPVPLPPLGPAAPMAGVRLDVVGMGEVQRAPDQVTIGAGVTSRSPQADAALRDNAAQMARVRTALQRAGIAARDIQTGTINLSQDYRPDPSGNGEMRPSGFVATNTVNIRFRDIARAGPIIDALVAAGANNVNGPGFEVADRPGALNEARMRAVADARARADLYARALGTRVRRIVAVSEAGPVMGPAVVQTAFAREAAADTQIAPGQLTIGANVTVTFELDQPAG